MSFAWVGHKLLISNIKFFAVIESAQTRFFPEFIFVQFLVQLFWLKFDSFGGLGSIRFFCREIFS